MQEGRLKPDLQLRDSFGRPTLEPSRSNTGETPVSAATVIGLKCRLCGKLYPKEALNFCVDDFGPLEVVYDYGAVSRTMTRASIGGRPRSMWRYHELLPVDGE